MEKREMICICCPLGCRLSAVTEEDKISVTGNSCPRGKTYAVTELTDPRRIVTSTVRVRNFDTPVVPVKTKEGVPKDKMKECVRELAAIELLTPVHAGDVVKENIAGTGIAVVATRDVA